MDNVSAVLIIFASNGIASVHWNEDKANRIETSDFPFENFALKRYLECPCDFPFRDALWSSGGKPFEKEPSSVANRYMQEPEIRKDQE